MKVVRKILYVIAGLLILLTILMVVCAYNPGLTRKIQGLIFRGKTVEVSSVNKEAAGEPSGDGLSHNSVDQSSYRKRTLEELGISEDSMIKDIDAYYDDCRKQISEHGIGQYSFENVIATEALIQEIYAKYSNNDYVDGYMNEVLNEIGALSYDMNLVVEELEGKHFRLTHEVNIAGEQ